MILRDSKGRFLKGFNSPYKKEPNFCLDCNKEICRVSKRCYSCAAKIKDNSHMKGKIPWNKGLTKEMDVRIKGKGFVNKEFLGNNGYLYVRKDGFIKLKHHINWMNNNGIYFIPEKWIVHHKDFNKLNNNTDNLLLVPKNLHTKLHSEFRLRNERGEYI